MKFIKSHTENKSKNSLSKQKKSLFYACLCLLTVFYLLSRQKNLLSCPMTPFTNFLKILCNTDDDA